MNFPNCLECKEKHYLGVYRYGEELFQLWQCKKCHHYYHVCKSDDKKKYIRIEDDDANEYLRDRIPCPQCNKHAEHKIKAKRSKQVKYNDKDFMYKYVVAKGNSYRFYCRNHPLKRNNRYEFNNSCEYVKMTLRDFFKHVNIYNGLKGKRLKEIDILTFLLMINMPKTIIAKILNKSRPTIDVMIRQNISTAEVASKYKKIINISDGGRKDFFDTLINIPIETLDDTENFVKIHGEKITFYP